MQGVERKNTRTPEQKKKDAELLGSKIDDAPGTCIKDCTSTVNHKILALFLA